VIWDEEFYLQTHPDVQTAVEAGDLPSGKTHWDLYGQNEGRLHRFCRTDATKPTIVFLTHSLGLGGVEQWICSLAEQCRQFNWVIGCLNTQHWHPGLVARLLQAGELHATSAITPGVTVHQSRDRLVKRTLAMADLVLTCAPLDLPVVETPMVFVAHGSCQFTRSAAKYAIAHGATHAAAVSEVAAQSVKDLFNEIPVIWNGVDEGRLQSHVSRDELRHQWGGSYDSVYDHYIGYLGRLANEKNVDSIIHAVAALPYHYKLVLIASPGGAQDRLLPLARTLLPGRLIETPATDTVGTLLGGLDCLVSASPREGFLLAAVEAMLCRVPVLTTSVGVIPELNAVSGGQLVEILPHDPTAGEIAVAIRHLCHHPPVARTAAAFAFAREHFTAETMSARWEHYLMNVLNTSDKT